MCFSDSDPAGRILANGKRPEPIAEGPGASAIDSTAVQFLHHARGAKAELASEVLLLLREQSPDRVGTLRLAILCRCRAASTRSRGMGAGSRRLWQEIRHSLRSGTGQEYGRILIRRDQS